MAFIPVPDVLEVSVHGAVAGSRPTVNVFHYKLGGSGGALPSDLTQATVDLLSAHIKDHYNALPPDMFNQTQWTRIVARDLTSESGPSWESTNGWPLVGTNSTSPLPGQIALVVSWLCDTRGRHYRGRTFLSGFAAEKSAGAGPVSGTLTHVGQFATGVLTVAVPGTGITFIPQVVSRYSGTHTNDAGKKVPTPRTTGISTPITHYRVGPVWDTLRRRRIVEV